MSSQFVNYVVGGRFDPPYMPTKTEPYIEGEIIESFSMGVVTQSTIVEDDAELLSVAVGSSLYEPRDKWNMYVNGKLICKNIYTKDIPEGMYFMAVIPIAKGTEITFEYHNEGGKPKYVWVNYQMLK